MVEKTKWLYKRSTRNPKLTDLELEVELSQDEIETIEEIYMLEHQDFIIRGRTGGSGKMRDYVGVPYGTALVVPRVEIFKKLKNSRNYIRDNIEAIGRQTPDCRNDMEEILRRISKLLGEGEDKA